MAKGPRPTLRFVDRLVLLVAWLVTCGVVYVLGYYVGKATPDRHASMEEREVRLPVTSTPPPEGQQPKEAKEFPSFYQALPAGERPIDVARGTMGTAPPAGQAATPPTTLSRATTTVPSVSRTTATAPAVTTTTVARTATTVAHTATTLPHAAAPPAATPATTPPATIVPPRAAGRGGFTVEASPTRSRSEAEQLLGSLRRRGYDASIVQMQRDGDTWYRLRVGRYQTAEQATDIMRRLRDVEGVTHVFVATE